MEVRNRFKGLDLKGKLPYELWMEVHDIVQETGIKTVPKKKKCKKVKWLSDEALQIAVKRRGAKSKGEKERYTHLNGEFQRIARRDKKAVQSNQCKERKTIEWERLEISSKNPRHQGNISCKDGLNIGQKAEAEDIKKRWQEYTEELYKKDLHDPDNHHGVITHLGMENQVGLRKHNYKDSGGDGIPVELFQNLKDDDVKVLHSIRHQI